MALLICSWEHDKSKFSFRTRTDLVKISREKKEGFKYERRSGGKVQGSKLC